MEDPIDTLLSTLSPSNHTKPQSQTQATTVTPPTARSIDQLLSTLGEPKKQQVREALLRRPHPSNLTVPEMTAYAIQQADIAQAEQAEAQQQQVYKKQRLQELKQQRQQELRSQAQQWLKTLDSKSTEGRWFEEFGCNYDSRLEAAIAYLEALQEVDHVLQ